MIFLSGSNIDVNKLFASAFHIIALTLLVGLELAAQSTPDRDSDTVVEDSVDVQNEKGPGTLEILFSGKPGKALTYSLVIPGAGQIYNKKYWKAPLVWGGIGIFVYQISRYAKQERSFEDEIARRVNNEMLEYKNYSTEALRRFRDITNLNKQYSYLGLTAVYLLGAIEAFVDRHLMEFDVSEELSMSIRLDAINNSPALSVRLTFQQ